MLRKDGLVQGSGQAKTPVAFNKPLLSCPRRSGEHEGGKQLSMRSTENQQTENAY